jgi:flagellar protein FliO/FliZ
VIADLRRFAATPHGRAAMLVAAPLAAVLLALAPGELAPAAARAAVAALVIALAALVVRRRGGVARPAPLVVIAREPLAGAAGLAVVEAGGRRLLLGFGRDGVRLVADLGAAADPLSPCPPAPVRGAGGGRRP